MISILSLSLIFAFFVLVGLVIWLLIYVFVYKKEPQDSPINLNFLSHHTGGHFLGVETSSLNAKEGRHFIKMMPKDVNIKLKDKDLKEEIIIADKNKIITYPKGTLSPDKNINIILPKHASDLHEAVKNSELGRALMMTIEIVNSANAEINSLLEGHKRKDEILERIGHAEVSKEHINLLDEFYRDTLKLAFDARSREKSPSSTTSSLPFPPRRDI
jgi:fumarate reductase subunit C